jgi:hypothetical protein
MKQTKPEWIRQKLENEYVYGYFFKLSAVIVDPMLRPLYEAFKALEEENRDLRCCGNCKHNNVMETGDIREENCGLDKSIDASYQYCKQWEFDGLKQEDREV